MNTIFKLNQIENNLIRRDLVHGLVINNLPGCQKIWGKHVKFINQNADRNGYALGGNWLTKVGNDDMQIGTAKLTITVQHFETHEEAYITVQNDKQESNTFVMDWAKRTQVIDFVENLLTDSSKMQFNGNMVFIVNSDFSGYNVKPAVNEAMRQMMEKQTSTFEYVKGVK